MLFDEDLIPNNATNCSGVTVGNSSAPETEQGIRQGIRLPVGHARPCYLRISIGNRVFHAVIAIIIMIVVSIITYTLTHTQCDYDS